MALDTNISPCDGSDFDADHIDFSGFFKERQERLWSNVVDTCQVIGSDADFKKVLALDLVVRLYIQLHPDPIEIKKRDASRILNDVLRKCSVGSDHEDARVFRRSLHLRWSIMSLMKRQDLSVDQLVEAEVAVMLSLVEDSSEHDSHDEHSYQESNNLPLIKLVESRQYFSDDMIGKLKELLFRSPIVGQIVVEQMNEVLIHFIVSSTQSKRSQDSPDPRFNNYNFVITDSLIYAIRKKPTDYDLIFMLMHIIPEEELNDEKLLVSLRYFVCDLLPFSLNFHEDFVHSVVGRRSERLAKLLLDIKWEHERKQKLNLLVTEKLDATDVQFKVQACLLLALRENKHFVHEILETDDVSDFVVLPRSLKLFYLLVKMSSCKKNSEEFNLYTQRLKQLLSTSHILLSKDEFTSDLVSRLQWIFSFSEWAASRFLNSSGQESKEESEEQIENQMFAKLFSCEPPIKVLSKLGFTSSLLSQRNHHNHVSFDFGSFDQFQEEVISLLKAYCDATGTSSEPFIWYSLLALKFSLTWMSFNVKAIPLDEESDTIHFDEEHETDSMSEGEDDADDELQEASLDFEFSSRIKSFVKATKLLTLRTEVLENMFSLLFLNKMQSVSEVSDEKKQEPLTFLVRNEVLPKYLALLKELTFETQTAVRFKLRKILQKSHQGQQLQLSPEDEEDVDESLAPSVSSMKTLEAAKQRLDRLLQYIHEGQWRLSVVQASFDYEEESNRSAFRDSSESLSTAPKSVMQAMLSSPQELLRNSLTHGHVDQAKQVFKLFENELKGSEETRQLKINAKVQELTDKLRAVFYTSNKRYGQPPVQPGLKFNESAMKGVKVNQLNHVFAEFYHEVSSLTLDENETALLLIDYGLTRCALLEASEAALDLGVSRLKGDSNQVNKVRDFVKTALAIIFVAKNSPSLSQKSFAEIVSFSINAALFSNPNSMIEDTLRRKKLTECIEDIRHLLKGSSTSTSGQPFDEEFFDGDSGRGISDDLNAHSSEQNRLLILFQKLLRLCPPGKSNYLKGLFYHVRRVSKVLNECRARSRTLSSASASTVYRRLSSTSARFTSAGYFSVLYQSPSAILCQMILKENVPPPLVDDLSQEMKVDLMGTLCSILCPPIKVVSDISSDGELSEFNLISTCYPALCDLIESYLTGSIRRMLSKDRHEADEEDPSVLIENHFKYEYVSDVYDDDNNRQIISKPDLVMYFKKKSPVLVEILRLLRLIDEKKLTIFDDDLVINKNTPLGQYIHVIRKMFTAGSDNETSLITLALNPFIPLTSSIVMKSLESYAQSKDLLGIYNVLNFIRHWNGLPFNSSLASLHTAVLSKLSIQKEDLSFLLQIRDARTKVDLLLEMIESSRNNPNSIFADSVVSCQALQAVRGSVRSPSSDLSAETMEQLTFKIDCKISEVSCFSKIAELSGLKTWCDALDSLTEADILTILKTKKQYNLSLEWHQLQRPDILSDPSSDAQIEELRYELLILSYAEKEDKEELERIVPIILTNSNSSRSLLLKCLTQIENWNMRQELMELAVQFEDSLENKVLYSNHLLGIQLIQLLSPSTRQHFTPLMSQPNLIIEQMLMNTEYTALEKAIKVQQMINCDDLIELYAKKAVDIKLIDESGSYNGSDYTCISSSFIPDSTSTTGRAFVMPCSIPSKEQWVPDSKVSHCMVCRIEKFSVLFNRKHHCRRCGRVVCHSCSDRFLVIPELMPDVPVRVCINCYAQMKSSDGNVFFPPSGRKESFSSLSSSISVYQWLLSLDEEQNAITRAEFYFEAAPSSSLCLSILKLHTNISSCISMLLDQMIKSLFEVLTFNQVDYGLLINIVKTLLISVKVIIETHLSESIEMRTRVEYVNLMLARIDIVNMLVQQSCINKDLINYIILNDSQSNQQVLVKLMEKLLEVERFELSLSIGKKYGLDVKGIWKTWAMICLRSGKFLEARSKFKHVMQEVTSSSGSNSVNSKVLQGIFDCFEDHRTNIRLNSRVSLKERTELIKKGKLNQLVTKEARLMSAQGSGLSTSSITSSMNETLLPKQLLDEALYYLQVYGTKEDLVRFYTKFNLWKAALDVFLTEHNPANLVNSFVQDFLLVSMKKSCYSKILQLIKATDPTLVKTWKCLIAACKYFAKVSFFNVLHSLQVFMSDFIRAAITQVSHFYLEKPYSSYDQLKERSNHLIIARNHLNSYLEHMSHIKNSPYILIQNPVQVKKNIRTINHQLDITKAFSTRGIDGYLPFNFDSMNHELVESPVTSFTSSGIFDRTVSLDTTTSSLNLSGSPVSDVKSYPLTLLDDSKARKTQLAALIVVEYGPKIADGFALTQQLIQDYKLDQGLVYRLAGRIILVSKKPVIIERLTQLIVCLRSLDDPGHLCDIVVGACIRSCNFPDLIEPMVKLLTSDINKIDAFIFCGKLRAAYLLAIRLDRGTDVRRILAASERTGQEMVKGWCLQWLEKNPQHNPSSPS